MRVSIGAKLTWGDEPFIVIAIDYRHAVLRSLNADFTRHVEVEELIRMPEVIWQVDETRKADASVGRILDALPAKERRAIDAWAEQLASVKAAVQTGQAAKYLFEDVRVAMAPWVEVASVETVRRKFHKYCAEGAAVDPTSVGGCFTRFLTSPTPRSAITSPRPSAMKRHGNAWKASYPGSVS